MEVWQVSSRVELLFCFLTCDIRLSAETRCLQVFARLALFKPAEARSWHGSALGLDAEGAPWRLEEDGYSDPLQDNAIFTFQREDLAT